MLKAVTPVGAETRNLDCKRNFKQLTMYDFSVPAVPDTIIFSAVESFDSKCCFTVLYTNNCFPCSKVGSAVEVKPIWKADCLWVAMKDGISCI